MKTNLAFPIRAGRWFDVGLRAAISGAVLLLFTTPGSGVERQVLRGHVPAAVAQLGLRPLSRLPATNRLNLAIGLPGRNPAALARLLEQLYDPASTNFHQFLTTEQFTKSFGPTEQDYQAVIAFAKAHGLSVTATHPNRMILDVSGSVVAIEAALHLTLWVYQHPTENRTFYAPDVEPSLDLAVPILSISGLDNYSLPRPRLKATPLPEGQPARPQAGSGLGGTYMGKDFRAAYIPGSTLAGAGQAVGLLEFDGYNASDISYYETKAGLPSVTLSNVLLDGVSGRPSGGELEVSLDIEMAISMAPGLFEVIVYEGTDWHDILNRMASDNLAKQLSCSWYNSSGKPDAVADQIWQEMAAQGQAFFNASGDNDAYTGPIDFPDDTPYITQVGGTTLTTTGPGGAWVSEQVWNVGNGTGSGGGISTSYAIPSYQTNIDMSANQGSTTLRNTPDVALTAGNIYARADGQDYILGGTSASAPLWAGFTALINEAARANGSPVVGFLNPAVYALGKSPAFTANFHDITSGDNESPASPTKFIAVPGYDLCTGWGTPLGTNLIYTIGVPEPLRITPGSDLLLTGPVGGPITPGTPSYSLTNKASGSLNWSVTEDATWLSVSPAAGTLTAGGPATNLIVQPNALASNLPPGNYTATLRFTNLSDSFAQTRQVTLAIVTPPLILSQPVSQAVFQGMTASFTVETTTNALQYYQWQFDNGIYQTNLTDSGGISGSGAATLTVSNVSPANVGAYSIVITNAAGSAISTVAFLSIVPWRPVVTVQPVGQTILPGATTNFTVAAVGTQPFTYRWQKDGISLTDGGNILGSATSTLTVTNATAANVGTYSVIVSNSLGSDNSAGAVLALIPVTASGVVLDNVYSFSGTDFGYNPYAGLVQANDGNFYGTALAGGATDDGTVFRMTTNGIVSLVHAFDSSTDGSMPYAALTQGTNGSLYGVNSSGGSSGDGTLFRMTTNGTTTVLASVNSTTSGASPVAGVVQGRDGNFYGTTLEGGLSDYGTLFRVTSANAFSTLRSFNGDNGAYSSSLLLQAADGNFYGTAENGGTNGGWGTVFRTTSAGVITPLVSFNYTNGGIPIAGLVQDTDGTFYGTTYYGGANGAGSVFKMAADGTLTSLYSFSGDTDGSNAYGGLLLSSDGNLYGTTESGGAYGFGTVFRVSPDGTLVTLAHFDGYQGANPEGTLAQGTDGNLYGTTAYGGQGGEGAIFRLSINSPLQITGQPQPQVAFLGDSVAFNVATFGGLPVSYQWRKNGQNLADAGSLSGSNARTLLLTNITVADAADYSVVVSNASGSVTSVSARLEVLVSPPYIVSGPDDQTVLLGATATFSVEADGTEPLLFQWQKNGANLTDGGYILGSATSTLTINSASAASAGAYSVIVSNDIDFVTSRGAVLTVVPVSQPGSVFATLHPFSGSSSGVNPYAGLVQGNDGLLYGTTLDGGDSGYGVAFSLASNGLFSVLHSFTNGLDGGVPFAGLVQGRDGGFYGAAFEGGASSSGTLFKINSAGGFTTLYSFFGGDDGSDPAASLIQGADGKLYGTAYQGGINDFGSVFSVTTNGIFAPLVSFDEDNGAYPVASLVQAANGVLYGTTYLGGSNGYGTVFSLTTKGALTTLVSFNYTNGATPVGALIQASDGFFYGTTGAGGTNGGWGTVFRMTADGTLTTLYSFGYDDGAYPAAGLIQATDGNFYGTTSEGGWGGQGTVFRITTNGVLTTVAWFNGANGANPQSPVIQIRDGSFCGTTEYGGTFYNGASGTGNGRVFRLVLPMFLSNPFTQAVATVSLPYVASLTANSIRPSGDTVLFAKTSGPPWLNVGSDGALSGTPAVSDIGTNTFTVSLFDTNAWSCAATMRVTVVPSPWIKAAIVRQGANLWLTWSGRTAPYQVQMATNLINPVWVNITAPLNTNSMPLAPTAAAAMYRIQSQ
jgi:uncharacterized repeat protein (TIGR03803 family)